MRRTIAAILVASMLHLAHANLTRAATFNWATIGNPGNAADPQTGRGAVSQQYRIATTEVTNAQYTQFLNAVDPFGLNQRGLYNEFMDENFGGGGILNTGTTDGGRYSVTPGFEQYPVSLVSWFSAARFANWLHNGQHGGDTENGAYTLLGGGIRPTNETTISRSANARYFIPTQDEWYKAAFHDASAGTAGVYFNYAMGTNTIPYSDNPNSLNTPDNTNVANYFNSDGIANGYNDGYAVSGTLSYPLGNIQAYTNVGAYTLAASPYGTFDQNGNVREWNETSFNLPSGGFARGVRGGSFFDSALGAPGVEALHKAGSNQVNGGGANGQTGFRIGSAVGVPDPTNYDFTVEYRTPAVDGPLIPGFDPIPATITAHFIIGNVYPGQTTIGLDQVQSFGLNIAILGFAPTREHLNHFQLALDSNGTPQNLNWGVHIDDICSGDTFCGIDIGNNNFTLELSGTDPGSGEPFRYFYSESTNTFVPIPEPATLPLALLTAAAFAAIRRPHQPFPSAATR